MSGASEVTSGETMVDRGPAEKAEGRRRRRGCGNVIRPSTICAGGRAGGCRASASISSMAAPPRNTASSATPTRSRRSSCCRATASSGKVSTDTETVRPALRRAVRRCPDGVGRPDVAGRREAVRARSAAPAHPLYPGDARQCLDRGDRQDRAGRVLVPALSLPLRRPRHHLRSRAARRRSRRPCAGADHRQRRQVEAAARHPQWREGAVPDQSLDHLSGADLAGLGDGAVAQRHAAHRESRALYGEATPASRPRRPCSCARGGSHTWDELRGCATAGSAPSSSRACCIRRTPSARSRSAPTA